LKWEKRVREIALRVLMIHSGEVRLPPTSEGFETAPFGPFMVERRGGLDDASNLLGETSFDAVLLCTDADGAAQLALWPGLSQATPDAAVVVWLPSRCDPELALRLMRAGVQDVIDGSSAGAAGAAGAAGGADVARSLRLAIERKRIEAAARKAYATDLPTGLPNRQQLIEHMSQLLALRGREPAPMALLVVRIEGFGTVEANQGRESANVLRRKVAVRLRAAVRASDVVAALSTDAFALLLASTEGPLDADRVVLKLLAALHKPFPLAGQQVGVAASVGVSRYPADGVDASVLMRQAVAAAATAKALGRGGFVNWRESVGHSAHAANDGEIESG
jgi:diguanylate cyclase (GGDEF)-like protein